MAASTPDVPPGGAGALGRVPREARVVRLLTVLFLVALLGMVLATFLDYGITTDEGVQHRYGRRIVRWYATRGADDGATRANDLYFYGGFFELCAQAAVATLPLGTFDARHLANALFGLAGVVAVWGIGSRIGGPSAGLLSALFLTLTPRFYGHFFANPKDLPFASLFAVAAWVALRSSDRVRRLGGHDVLLTGLAIGLASGVRVAGVVLYGAVAVLWLGCGWLARREDEARGSPRRELTGGLSAIAGVIAVGWTVMVAFWPWAQLDPLRNPFRALRKFSNFWVDASVFFDGRLLLSGDLPRDYMPRLFALTLPGFYAIAYLLGLFAVVSWRRERRSRPDVATRTFQRLWLAVLALAPVGWVVVSRTPVYNGIRHLLFVVPFLAVLAGLSVAAWFERPWSRPTRLVAAAGLALSLGVTLVDMVQLHPYQYVYFNRLFAGGLPAAAARYETDYLCASYKEGIEWMAREYLRPDWREPVRVDGNCSHVPFWYYLGRGAVETTNVEPNVFFATTTFGDHQRTAGRVVHVVSRQGVPLLYVFEQRPPR